MEEAGKRKEMVENRLCERTVCVTNLHVKSLCDRFVCVCEAVVWDGVVCDNVVLLVLNLSNFICLWPTMNCWL